MSFFYLLLNKTIHYFPARFAFISQPEVVTLPHPDVTEELKERLMEKEETPDPEKDFEFAMQLMQGGAYQDCVEVYTMIAQKYPETQALCECQIGAAYFFMQKYEQALDFYLRARMNGMDADMMDDNIWELCWLQYEHSQQLLHIQHYLKHCPEGKYSTDATTLLMELQ